MSAQTDLIRRVLTFTGICLWLCWPRAASAQGADPLPGCNPATRVVEQLGPSKAGTDDGFLRINVHIVCDQTTIFAEDVWWDAKVLHAEGDVLVSQPGLRVNAARMEMDRVTKLATFYFAYGTASPKQEPGERTIFGTGEADIMFRADKIERLGPKTYRLTHGSFSSCLQANPRWQMVGSSGTVILDDHASMRNVQFKVKGIPVLYIPYMYYPLRKDDRKTGFLIPSYSSSGVRGNGISNAFFWAINKQMDATLFHDYYTKAGQGAAAEYRYASGPGAGGTSYFHMLDEKERLAPDGTVERDAHRSYTFKGSVNQPIGNQFFLAGSVNYFTDITTQQVYQQNVGAASNRTREINLQFNGWVPLSGALRPPRLNIRTLFQRTEVFNGTASSLQGSTPRINLTLNTPIRRSREACGGQTPSFFCSVYFNASGDATYLVARGFDPAQPTTSSRRFDSSTGVNAPLSSLEYLRVNTNASVRLTEWLDSLDPLTGLPVAQPITRSMVNLHADAVGPSFARVFLTPDSTYASGFLHQIDPRVSVDWLSSFDQEASVIPIDNVDRVVGGTTTVTYSLTNTILAHTKNPDTRRSILSVVIGQSYYTRAQAGAVDPMNPTGSAGSYTPVGLTTNFSPVDRVSAQFRLYKNSRSWPTPARPAQDFSYTLATKIELDRFDLRAGWSRVKYFTTEQGFISLPDVHALNGETSVRTLDGRMGATYGFNFDVMNQKLIQQRIVAYYHAQCCGIAFDYQIFSSVLSSVPKDRRFAVTFTLAGIGSFSPPLGAFGR